MSQQPPADFLFKIIIIGDTGTGKSCLLRWFLDREFKKNMAHTVGVEFGSQVLSVGDRTVKLQIWDTAGQERFRSVTRGYYRGAVGCLLVYDVTNRDTFQSLPSWLVDARSLAREDISIVVAGNKCDKKASREVPLLTASRFAQENDLQFMETSAATGECVVEVFTKLAQTILAKVDAGQLDASSLPTRGSFVDDEMDDDDEPPRRACAC